METETQMSPLDIAVALLGYLKNIASQKGAKEFVRIYLTLWKCPAKRSTETKS